MSRPVLPVSVTNTAPFWEEQSVKITASVFSAELPNETTESSASVAEIAPPLVVDVQDVKLTSERVKVPEEERVTAITPPFSALQFSKEMEVSVK